MYSRPPRSTPSTKGRSAGARSPPAMVPATNFAGEVDFYDGPVDDLGFATFADDAAGYGQDAGFGAYGHSPRTAAPRVSIAHSTRSSGKASPPRASSHSHSHSKRTSIASHNKKQEPALFAQQVSDLLTGPLEVFKVENLDELDATQRKKGRFDPDIYSHSVMTLKPTEQRQQEQLEILFSDPQYSEILMPDGPQRHVPIQSPSLDGGLEESSSGIHEGGGEQQAIMESENLAFADEWSGQQQPLAPSISGEKVSMRGRAKSAGFYPQIRSFVERHEPLFLLFRDKPAAVGTFARAFTDAYLHAQLEVLEKNVQKMHEKSASQTPLALQPKESRFGRKVGVKRSILEAALGEDIVEYGGGFSTFDEFRKFLSGQKFLEFLAFQRLMDINQRVFDEGVRAHNLKENNKEAQTDPVQVFTRLAPKSMPYFSYHPSALLPSERIKHEAPATHYQLADDAGENPTLCYFTVLDDPHGRRFEVKSMGITFGKQTPRQQLATEGEGEMGMAGDENPDQKFSRTSAGPLPHVDVDLTDLENIFSPTGRCLVSRMHAYVFYDMRKRMFLLLNYGRNGTMVEDTLYSEGPVCLANDAVVQFGHVRMIFNVSTNMIPIDPNL